MFVLNAVFFFFLSKRYSRDIIYGINSVEKVWKWIYNSKDRRPVIVLEELIEQVNKLLLGYWHLVSQCQFKSHLLCFASASCYGAWEGSRWWSKYLGIYHPVGNPNGILDSWLQPHAALAIAAIWRVYQPKEGLCHSTFQISKNINLWKIVLC